MLKHLLLMSALITLILNMLLTWYLIKDKASAGVKRIKNREIVSFDLSFDLSNGEKAAATDILDTEVISSLESEKR